MDKFTCIVRDIAATVVKVNDLRAACKEQLADGPIDVGVVAVADACDAFLAALHDPVSSKWDAAMRTLQPLRELADLVPVIEIAKVTIRNGGKP